MSEHFLQAAALGFWASAQPGPFQAFLLGHTLRGGRRGGILAAFAPLAAEAPIVALALLVLTQLPPLLLRALHLGGGALLLWSAWSTLRTGLGGSETGAPWAGPVIRSTDKAANGLARAVATGLTVPGPWIGWTLICGPLLVQAWRASPQGAAAFLVGFYGALCGTNVLWVLLVSSARALGPRASRVIMVLTAGALLVLAARLMWQGASDRLPGA